MMRTVKAPGETPYVWAAQRSQAPGAYRRRLFVSADDHERASPAGCRNGKLVSRVRRLFVPGVQYQHRLLAHRCACAGPLGESFDDVAIIVVAFDPRTFGRPSRQYSLIVLYRLGRCA